MANCTRWGGPDNAHKADKLSLILELNADRLDFMNDLVDRIEVLETIEGHL